MFKLVYSALALLLLSFPCGAQELAKSITWDNLRAHPAPLPVTGELKPVHSSLDTPSFWSIGVETLDRDYADFEKFRQYVGETGAGYARLQSGWAKTEKKKGKYDFSWLDAHVDGLIAEGLRPWMCLCYGNPLYSSHGHDLNAKLFPDGPVMNAWLRYVRACVTHFKGKVSMWEVWNEPDGGENQDSYALYANLFIRTAKLIRELDPDAGIAAFGSCSPDRRYIRQAMELIAAAGGVQYMDYLTYHAYWPLPEKIVPAVLALREDISRYSPSIKLLQGETGCPAQLEYDHAMHSIEWNEYSQAKWDLRQAMIHWGLGIPYSFFTMVDLNYGWMLQSFGLIRMNGVKSPVYKRPKFYAVQHVTRLFSADLKPFGGIRVECASPREITCVGVSREGKPAGCLLWLSGARPSASLDRVCMDVCLHGMKFKDPVYVDLLSGYIHEVSALATSDGFKALPLWDSPILIIERDIL